MPKVKDVFNTLESLAPTSLALSYDNVGILVGDENASVSKILVALDITHEIIDEAVSCGTDLIVAHHPVIFDKLAYVTAQDLQGGRVMALIKNGISAICMHTNLDAARGGVNDALAAALGLSEMQVIEKIGDCGIGRVGVIPEISFDDFLTRTMRKLNCNGARYCKERERVSHVAVGGGSCGDFLEDVARRGCDTFVTADIKHNVWTAAHELHINLIDAGHFPTENVITPGIRDAICADFTDITVICSEKCVQPEQFAINQEVSHGA